MYRSGPASRSSPGIRKFVSGGYDRDPRLAKHGYAVVSHAGSKGGISRIHPLALMHQAGAGLVILSLEAIVIIWIYRFKDMYLFFSIIRIFLADHCICPFRNRGSGHDPHCFFRPYPSRRIASGKNLVYNIQFCRILRRRAFNVLSPQRISIQRRSCKRRLIDGGNASPAPSDVQLPLSIRPFGCP